MDRRKLKTYNWPFEEAFCFGSTIARHHLKRRIIKENLIKYECKECDQNDIWNGKKLVLQLDHINGINNDNRLENLRFLCPNCHSQQGTYAAKNKLTQERNTKPYYVSRRVVAIGKTSVSNSEVAGSTPESPARD